MQSRQQQYPYRDSRRQSHRRRVTTKTGIIHIQTRIPIYMYLNDGLVTESMIHCTMTYSDLNLELASYLTHQLTIQHVDQRYLVEVDKCTVNWQNASDWRVVRFALNRKFNESNCTVQCFACRSRDVLKNKGSSPRKNEPDDNSRWRWLENLGRSYLISSHLF